MAVAFSLLMFTQRQNWLLPWTVNTGMTGTRAKICRMVRL
jgi:hypothetical protein